MRYIGFRLSPFPGDAMMPEELNRTIEFIVASQARLTAAQEHDRHGVFSRSGRKNGRKSDRLMDRQGELLNRTTDLLVLQSQRMDRMDTIYQAAQSQNEKFQQQALRLLHMILDLLRNPGRPN